ncbi:6568_t:CDS:2, partial [Racocetra fulgida]
MVHDEKIDKNSSSESESSDKNDTNEELERNLTATNKLVNKLKLCCSYEKKCKEESMLLQPYRNTGNSPANKLSIKTISEVKSFIKLVKKQYSKALAVQKYIRKNDIDEELNEQFTMHIQDYHAMREVYENYIQIAKKSNQSSFCVFSFDFTQNVKLSHNPQQPENDEFQLLKQNVYIKSLNPAKLPIKGLLEEKQ